MKLPKETADALASLAQAEGITPVEMVARLVAAEHARREANAPARPREPARCVTCGEPVPESRGARRTCSTKCARKPKPAVRAVRFVVLDGHRRSSAHAREAEAEAAAQVIRARFPHTADAVRVIREEL